jgi:type II secretory pathway pseudopilin PulG
MKRLLIVIAVIGLSASLGAQSLADLAKREKARRESLKDRHAVVIKAADLMRVRKVAAVEVAPPEAESEEALAAEGQDVQPETVSQETEPVALPSGSGAPSGRRIVPAVAPDGPLITGDVNRDQTEGGGTLEAQLQAAKDRVDLLTTKMAALRQQFEFQDAMVPGYVIQQQLEETSQRLLKAQALQARIEAQIAKSGTAKKAPGGLAG